MVHSGSHASQDKDNENFAVWNILVVSEKANEQVVYDIVKIMFEKKA